MLSTEKARPCGGCDGNCEELISKPSYLKESSQKALRDTKRARLTQANPEIKRKKRQAFDRVSCDADLRMLSPPALFREFNQPHPCTSSNVTNASAVRKIGRNTGMEEEAKVFPPEGMLHVQSSAFLRISSEPVRIWHFRGAVSVSHFCLSPSKGSKCLLRQTR